MDHRPPTRARRSRKERPLYRESDFQRRSDTTSRGSLDLEPYRSGFRRDYARILHSPSFRRLQGKTQLFPSDESDFYRNRLTHSLEVAQVAKSIAIRANQAHPYFAENPIDLDLVELASLAHDLGHPPFGHNGEDALDRLLRNAGGFEGNAQTLRIISRLEKKQTIDFPATGALPELVREGRDLRLGLNLTARSLAAVLKYDEPIPQTSATREQLGKGEHPAKGFYAADHELVRWIRHSVVGPAYQGKLKTIECSIMDVADDIAYSTYDLEDSFKAGFLSPLVLTASDPELKQRIAAVIQAKIANDYPDAPADDRVFGVEELNQVLLGVFGTYLFEPSADDTRKLKATPDPLGKYALVTELAFSTSRLMCEVGYIRTDFTSSLVGASIRSIQVDFNDEFPQLSRVRLSLDAFKMVETLKRFSYESIIMSPRIKLSEKRGQRIIDTIFDHLTDRQAEGHLLMPEDWRAVYLAKTDDDAWRARAVCDYIAGMTDRYCVEFYNRLVGTSVPSISKAH